MAPSTIPRRLLEHARRRGSENALYERDTDGWRSLTWHEYANRARAFAAGLLKLGCEKGDAIAIIGDGCADWLVADMAAMMIGAVPAGIYTTSTPEQALYILAHSQAKVFVCQTPEIWHALSSRIDELPHLQRVILMHGVESIDESFVTSFSSFLVHDSAMQSIVDDAIEGLQPDDLATLIYTSGTTGAPKAVMLSHENLAWTAEMLNEATGRIVSTEDCVVSYLPLSHIAEQMFSIHLPATYGFPVWFAGSLERLKDTLIEARPTLFLAVPRVWEKFMAALDSKLSELTGFKRSLVKWAMDVGRQSGHCAFSGQETSSALRLKHWLAERVFFKPLLKQLGLDRLRLAVSGAAPISRRVIEFFQGCGLLIHEVYGQSEDTGPTTFNRPEAGWRRLGTVGRPVPGVEVRIAGDGEICVRGPNVFQGYLYDPQATAEALIDGWLHSGDIGQFDSDGFLMITDRKKDIIITAGGKNIAPQQVESQLKRIDGISQAVVIGDKRRYLVAILTVDAERADALARAKGWLADRLAEQPEFKEYVLGQLDAINDRLARYEQIKYVHLLENEFTVESGELTPTQKVKRRSVELKYAAEIDALYAR